MWWDLEPKYPKVIYSKKVKRNKLLKAKISKERWDLKYFFEKLNTETKQYENNPASMSIESVTINNENLEEQNQPVTSSNSKSKQSTL